MDVPTVGESDTFAKGKDAGDREDGQKRRSKQEKEKRQENLTNKNGILYMKRRGKERGRTTQWNRKRVLSFSFFFNLLHPLHVTLAVFMTDRVKVRQSIDPLNDRCWVFRVAT